MALEIHTWKIIGISALIQNNPAGTMQPATVGIKAGKTQYVDENEAEIRTYRNEKKQEKQPS